MYTPDCKYIPQIVTKIYTPDCKCNPSCKIYTPDCKCIPQIVKIKPVQFFYNSSTIPLSSEQQVEGVELSSAEQPLFLDNLTL